VSLTCRARRGADRRRFPARIDDARRRCSIWLRGADSTVTTFKDSTTWSIRVAQGSCVAPETVADTVRQAK
jgi:hypothetical protein